ncbi:hypothetical protein N9W11_03160 [Psychrosphaera haliotis]|uniref:hypothetical protein n=1 Tax=Psychrosphaera haliotis TaxID=555083 RepID=UPI0023718846|nr:hypothetical protein [Psychrosphaera haliotis]
MYKRQLSSNRQSRVTRSSKGGFKEALIDKQVLVIHVAIADKLIAANEKGDTIYLEQIQKTLDSRRDSGRMRYGEYLTWLSVLEVIDDSVAFKNAILEDSHQMKKYRRRTPLVGILTEAERQRAIEENAVGSIDKALF